MSLVSVIVPTYNRAALIVETLESVAAQSYRPIELIVSDDASTDETRDVVARWIGQGSFRDCVYLPQSSNRGKSAAVNAALERASGDYVMILDSDDVLLPDAIATEVRFLEQHPDVGMVSAKAFELAGSRKTNTVLGVFENGREIQDVVGEHGSLLLKGNTVISSTALLRASVVHEIGRMDQHLRIIHDWEYWIRISERFPVGFIGKPLVYYRTGLNGSLSLDRVRLFSESRDLLLRALGREVKPAVLRALIFQTRANARLAFGDGALAQCARILVAGGGSVLRALLHRKNLQ